MRAGGRDEKGEGKGGKRGAREVNEPTGSGDYHASLMTINAAKRACGG